MQFPLVEDPYSMRPINPSHHEDVVKVGRRIWAICHEVHYLTGELVEDLHQAMF
jgi:hypothetical protein